MTDGTLSPRQQEEPDLNLVLSYMADGVLLIEPEGTVRYANPAAEELFGYESGRMVGCMLGYPVMAGMAEVEIPHLDGAVSVAEFRTVETRIGGRIFYLASFRDITKRKRAEERVAKLSRELVNAYERAQREIGHELHDGIGQLLLGVRLSLDGARRLDGEPAMEQLDSLAEMVDEVINEVRRLSHALKPAVLDDFSFRDAVESHVERLQDETGLAVELEHSGLSGRNTDMVETVAFRILQEALTNVLRHADVREAQVRIAESEESLFLRVSDAGRGFDPSAQPEDSIGLKGMAERAELIGGNLDVQSAPGAGTVVTATLPLL